MSAPDSASLERNAHFARSLLSDLVQALAAVSSARGAAREIDEARSALVLAERAAPNAQAVYLRVRSAIGHLARALSKLEALQAEPELSEACEAVARALALLYPVARAHQRRRRQVTLSPSLAPPSGELAHLPPAPQTTGGSDAPADFSGSERRNEPRVRVEADVGLLSQSHFYTGLSRDVSRGGLFVATYNPSPPGTEVALYFVLPNGHTIDADGVVAWTSEASGDSPPGMGIRFDQVSTADLAAIEAFCQERTPIQHDGTDE